MSEFNWAEELQYSVTVCDKEANVVYQNAKARKTFEKYGNLIGKNLKDCHSDKSWEQICRLIADGGSNTYTIDKKGIKKLIHQSPWYKDGEVMGLVELSIELPENIPHYFR